MARGYLPCCGEVPGNHARRMATTVDLRNWAGPTSRPAPSCHPEQCRLRLPRLPRPPVSPGGSPVP
jgi:hypothetical protein